MDLAALEGLSDSAFLDEIGGWIQAPEPAQLALLLALTRRSRHLGRRAEGARVLSALLSGDASAAWPMADRRRGARGLLELAGDRTIWPPARGFAYEGLPRLAELLPPRAGAVVGRGLTDWDGEVRFWACYAAWRLGDARARPALQPLTRQHIVVPALWSIHLEARDALAGLTDPDYVPPDHEMSAVGTYHALGHWASRWPFDPAALTSALPGVSDVLGFEAVGHREIAVEVPAGGVDADAGWQPAGAGSWRGWCQTWGERGMVRLIELG